MNPAVNKETGFTLVEMVIVIVMTGILAGVVTMIISGPMRGYVELENRAQLVDIADTALIRMTREIRLALPNSIRITTSGSKIAVEFLRVMDGGRYRAKPQSGSMQNCGASGGLGDPLEFTCADTSLDTLGDISRIADIHTGNNCAAGITDCLVVYNTGQAGANAYALENVSSILSAVDGGADDGSDKLTFSAFTFPLASPAQRFYIVDTPVSFVCDTSTKTITRFDKYPFSSVQSLSPGGSSALLVNEVSACNFSYSDGTHTRGGIATLTLSLTQPQINESVTLVQQVHIQNLP